MLKHPDIDGLVAEFKLTGQAVALLTRKRTDRTKLIARQKQHELLKDHMDNLPARKEELQARLDELSAEIAEKAAIIRKKVDSDTKQLVMTKVEAEYGSLSDEDLGQQVIAARDSMATISKLLKSLLLETARRRANAKADVELNRLSQRARNRLTQKIEPAKVPTSTKVNG